jgi:hypothetical protein
MKYRYKCTKPELPANATSPVMDFKQIEDWLNGMDNLGWVFVGHAERRWNGYDDPFIQSWWIFKKEI